MENKSFNINNQNSSNQSTLTNKKPHSVNIDRRQRATLQGVEKVISSNENLISLLTTEGGLVLNGSEFKIIKFDAESGFLSIEGKTNSFKYTAVSGEKTGSVFKKIFK
ncbi:MAG: hypothetical protein FWC11_01195 [Firmicutes bacterium]|nr:hypothetical protein [Bacillota bacterium]